MRTNKKIRVIITAITATAAAIGTTVFFIKRRNNRKARA